MLEIFANLTQHRLYCHGQLAQVFGSELDTRQRSVLRLLGVPLAAYQADR